MANTYGSCVPVYYNDPISQTFTSQSCPPRYIGGTVTYTVPANKYYSLVSKPDANRMAQEEIDANGDAYANDPANAVCTIDYNPRWTADENAPTDCRWVNGEAHIFRLYTDTNPNSSSYGTTSWLDTGEQGSCPPPSNCTITYTNTTGYAQYIQLYNTSTGESFYFYVYPGVSGILGDIPSGNYNVVINPTGGYYYYFYYNICSSYYTYGYPDGYFDNVYIGCGCSDIYIGY